MNQILGSRGTAIVPVTIKAGILAVTIVTIGGHRRPGKKFAAQVTYLRRCALAWLDPRLIGFHFGLPTAAERLIDSDQIAD
jgi:hypothetical protein